MDSRAGRNDLNRARVCAVALVALVALASGGCRRSAAPLPASHESLLGIAAEMSLVLARDPYTDPPGEDLLGQNIARATLVRLANYGDVAPGSFEPEIALLRARAYEALGDFESARLACLEAASPGSPLAEVGHERAAINARLLDPLDEAEDVGTLDDYLAALEARVVAFEDLAATLDDAWYAALARVEAENAAVVRAEMLAINRWMLDDGEERALEALRGLLATHAESHRAMEHALRLARFHRELAEEELRLRPAHSVEFRAGRVLGHLDECLDVLARVAQADGRAERLVAQRELDAVLALRELVMSRAR